MELCQAKCCLHAYKNVDLDHSVSVSVKLQVESKEISLKQPVFFTIFIDSPIKIFFFFSLLRVLAVFYIFIYFFFSSLKKKKKKKEKKKECWLL